MINPVAPFYEYYLAVEQIIPFPFKAFLGLVMATFIVCSLFSILFHLR